MHIPIPIGHFCRALLAPAHSGRCQNGSANLRKILMFRKYGIGHRGSQDRNSQIPRQASEKPWGWHSCRFIHFDPGKCLGKTRERGSVALRAGFEPATCPLGGGRPILLGHRSTGGQRGIRTLETVPRLHTFQACAFDRSATCPWGDTTNRVFRRQDQKNRFSQNHPNAKSGSCSGTTAQSEIFRARSVFQRVQGSARARPR